MSGAAPDPFGSGILGLPATTPDRSGKRRVHPLTPLVQTARAIGVALAIAFGLVVQTRSVRATDFALLALLVIVVLAAVAAGFGYFSWRALTYWFDADGDLRVDSGVLTRSQRRLQLSRLQSVDVVAPLVARIFGLAELHVKVAGAGDSRVTLQYLARAEADALRNEVIARAAGVRHDAAEAAEQVLASVTSSDLIRSLMLRWSTFLMTLLSVLILVGSTVLFGPAGLVFVVLGGLPILSLWGEFSKYYGFTIAESADGLRLRHGLLQTESQTVPPGRVQAIEFVQPLLWRRRGWVRLQVNVAGVHAGADQPTGNVLLPVAPWDVAVSVVARLGVAFDSIVLEPAPSRASRRAWIQYPRLGVGYDQSVLLSRRGRLVRRWAAVPHARIQSVRVTQGPWQRALDLASVHLDTAPGPVDVVVLHRDIAEAGLLAADQARRSSVARTSDRSIRWARATDTDSSIERGSA